MLTQPQQNEPDDKSVAREIAEQQAKKQGKKALKRLGKKAAKLAAKLAKALVKKLGVLLLKLLGWLAATIGLPVIAIVLGIIFLVFIVSLSFSLFFGTGEGLEGEDRKIYEYIVQQANKTVDMNSSIERPYRVPEKLIAATIQLDVMRSKDKRELYAIIENMAKKLTPVFYYGKYNEWTKKQVTVCENNVCTEGKIVHTDKYVNKLESVEYWNGSTSFSYTAHQTDWETKTKITYKTIEKKVVTVVPKTIYVTVKEEVCEQLLKMYPYPHFITECKTVTKQVPKTIYEEVTTITTEKIEIKTITKTKRQYFTSTKSTVTDYSTFDNILNSLGLGITDKRLIEANYLFLDGSIAYTDWLKTMGAGDLGLISFDGTIIPGGGVPPQYMPYYLSAEKKYGVHWYVIAAIHFVETGFSTHKTMISSVGAVGHFQFLPATWIGWKYDIGGGMVPSDLDITNLSVIASGRGYGKDANGDGKADPWDLEDAVHTAASYLAGNKYSTDPRNAIWHYNHADWYVNKVLSHAERFKNSATYEGGKDMPALNPGSFMRPTTGPFTSGFAERWGRFHFGVDLGSGGKKNLPIVASADGVVTRSDFSSSYGHVVYIKHKINGQVFETVYAHMQNRAVAKGSTVKQGQFLGYMGNTGDSKGVHLHFEIHKNAWTQSKSNALDPARYIPL